MTTQQEQQKKQYTGYESSPIDLTTSRAIKVTGYDEELEDESLYPSRLPTSTRRYNTNQQALTRTQQRDIKKRDRYDDIHITVRRKSAQSPRETTRPQAQTTTQERERRTKPVPASEEEEEPRTEPARTREHRAQAPRFHWLLLAGIGMLALLLLCVASQWVGYWWNGYQNDLHYGRPRTYQTDATVGHNDAQTPSHFIAINLHGHVEVIEFPGGDATHAKVYQIITISGVNSDLDVVTVTFQDVNGDGKPDMIVHVGGIPYPFVNDNGTFRLPHPSEQIHM